MTIQKVEPEYCPPTAPPDGPVAELVIGFRAWLSMIPAVPTWWLPLLMGSLSGFGLLGVYGAPLLVFTLSVLFAQVRTQAPERTTRTVMPFALGFFGLHLQWLYSSLNSILGVPAGLLVVPVVLLLAGGLTLTLALSRRFAGRFTLLALPAAWILFDWLRTLGPMAFPWGSLGYAASRTVAVQLASVGGVPLLAALVVGTAALLAHRQRWSLLLAQGLIRPTGVPARTALLVQGAIDPLAKLRGTVDATSLYRNLSRAALPGPAALSRQPDVMLWPETAIPFTPGRPGQWPALSLPGVPLITGAPGRQQGNLYNSAFAMSAAGTFRYDKVRTVPFGESFPGYDALRWLYRPVFRFLGVPGLQNVKSGTRSPVLQAGSLRYLVSICYESVFPGLARRGVREGGQVLVTLSNDAWFGRSAGAEQHFLMCRVRATETRRYWLRAGNDGITAVTDPYGRVQARLERGRRATLLVGFTPLRTVTLYTRYGDWVVVLAASHLLICIVRGARVNPARRLQA